jgi:hypothetical protein
VHGHGAAVADETVDDYASRRGEVEHRDRGAGGDEGADVLTAQATEAAGDDGEVAVEAKAIGEGVGVGQEEGLPPRDLQKTPELAQNLLVWGQPFMN